MKQSSIIFGALLVAFVFFITMKGKLPAYLDLFKAKPKEATAGGATAPVASPSPAKSSGPKASKVVQGILDKAGITLPKFGL